MNSRGASDLATKTMLTVLVALGIAVIGLELTSSVPAGPDETFAGADAVEGRHSGALAPDKHHQPLPALANEGRTDVHSNGHGKAGHDLADSPAKVESAQAHDTATGHGGSHGAPAEAFPFVDADYAASEAAAAASLGKEQLSLFEKLIHRATVTPINVIATLIFFAAIVHTFLAGKFMDLAHQAEHDHEERLRKETPRVKWRNKPVSLRATVLHFLGEVEAIFGIWMLPLLVVITTMKGWEYSTHYIDTRVYTEPIFVVVIMAIASSRPVVLFAESALSSVARLGNRSPAAWWLSILTIAPLMGSFITEPAAITIAALLLGQQFYKLNPSQRFKYATLGLLFVNVSVGGTLTHFAAPPVLMVATKWGWDMPFMFLNFGWKAIVGILISNMIYFLAFRHDFKGLAEHAALLESKSDGSASGLSRAPIPAWITATHLAFMAWTVFTLHHPALFVIGFLFFIAFMLGTSHHQDPLKLKGPLLVGFFLAGLVTHGGLQGWWISPVLSALGEFPLFIGSTILTAFNDNAAITFLASQVPVFDVDTNLEYAVVAGAVTGGGLTVIANAPNPAGQSLLQRFFDGGIAPLALFLSALIPTIIMALCFLLL